MPLLSPLSLFLSPANLQVTKRRIDDRVICATTAAPEKIPVKITCHAQLNSLSSKAPTRPRTHTRARTYMHTSVRTYVRTVSVSRLTPHASRALTPHAPHPATLEHSQLLTHHHITQHSLASSSRLSDTRSSHPLSPRLWPKKSLISTVTLFIV